MKTAIRICVIMFLIQSAFAAEPPQMTISTNVIGPPQFRSHKLTKVYKRGQTEILRDMREGPGENAALRMQHIVHNGDAVYSVRETREGTIVASTHGAAVSVLQIDANRDGKSDLILILKGGEMSEAYLVEKDGFLSPVPSKVLFNEEGTKQHHETVVEDTRKLISQLLLATACSRARAVGVTPRPQSPPPASPSHPVTESSTVFHRDIDLASLFRLRFSV